MEYKFNFGDKTYTVKLEQVQDSYTVNIDDKQLEVKEIGKNLLQNCLSLLIDGKLTTIYVTCDKDKIYTFIDGHYFTFTPYKKGAGKAKDTGGKQENKISSPMPGTIVKIPVKVGDTVEIGQTLAIVEAMKMQNELKSGIKGKVKQINFKEGVQVDAFSPIVELENL